MKTFESFQWHISECCKRQCRVRSGSALELQMEENFCPKDFTVRISNFGIDVCLIFFLDFLIWFYLSVCLSLILLKNIGRNILITCIISTLHARQRGWKDHFQVLLKYMKKLTPTPQEVGSSSKVACQHFSEWSWLCTEAPKSRYIPLQKKRCGNFLPFQKELSLEITFVFSVSTGNKWMWKAQQLTLNLLLFWYYFGEGLEGGTGTGAGR